MSEITERSAQTVSPPGGQPARSHPLGSVFGLLARQREATVFVVAVVLLLYFGIRYNSTFVSQTNLANLLSETAAPIIIIAIGGFLILLFAATLKGRRLESSNFIRCFDEGPAGMTLA